MSLLRMRRQMRYLKYLLAVFIFIFIAGAVFMAVPNMGAGDAVAQQGYVLAKIGDREVSNEELDRNIRQIENQMEQFTRGGGSLEQQAQYPQYAYDQILQGYAMAAAAEANGISVSAGQADEELNRQIKERLEQIGKGSTPEEKEQIRQALRRGADLESMRRGLLAQRLQEKLSADARPVEVKIAKIDIRTGKRTADEARKLAQDVARQARAGADFGRLVAQHSEDPETKKAGGVAGWVSAMPSVTPQAKPGPNDAKSFDPAITAAALRLRVGEVSEPVQTPEGFVVVKAVEERNYEPKPEPPKPGDKTPAATANDPKKRDEAIQRYRETVATTIMQGLVSEQRARLESQVEPRSAWLRGHLLEQALGFTEPPAGDKALKPEEKTNAQQQAERVKAVIAAYDEALKGNEPAAGAPLAYKVAGLHQKAAGWLAAAGQADAAKAERQAALELTDKWATRTADASFFMKKGELLTSLGRKTDAVAAYQKAMTNAWNNPMIFPDLSEKFKELGRKDLADQAMKQHTEQLAKAAEQQKQQSFSTQGSPAPASEGETITVKTGDVDPKTGKPKIVSVTKGDGKGGTAAKEKAPAAP